MWPLRTVTAPNRLNSLSAIFRTPAPLRIDGPKRHVGKDHDRCAIGQPGYVLLQPFELFAAEHTQAARLEVNHVYQADEMHSSIIEAAPAVAASALAIAFEIKFCIVGEDVMFA